MSIQRSFGPNSGQKNRADSRGRSIAAVLLLALLLAFLPGAAPMQVSQDKLHPQLVTLAATQTDQMVPVIVQGQTSFDDLLQKVDWRGSTLTGDLHFINAVSALVPASALQTIARSPAVKWISPDGPMVSAGMAAKDMSRTTQSGLRAVLATRNATAVFGSASATNPVRATGAPDASFADVAATQNNNLVLNLGEVVPSGTVITLRLKYHTDSGGSVPIVDVDGGPDGTIFTNLSTVSGLTNSFADYTYTVGQVGGINYLRIRARAVAGNEAAQHIDVDAVSFSTSAATANLPQSVRDEFATASFSNNNGTQTWNGDWVENEPQVGGPGSVSGAGPQVGHVRIDQNQLSLEDYPNTGGQPGAARRVDLSHAENATLSFDFATTWGVDWEDAVALEVSVDGVNFVRLDTFTGIVGASNGSRSYDISGFRSVNTTVRFFVASMYGDAFEQFFVDNLQVAYSLEASSGTPSPSEPQGPVSGTIRDDFARESYRNNDGSRIWTSRWLEVMDDDSPTNGKITVNGSGYLELRMDGNFGKSIARTANLANASSAQLRYYIRKDTNLKNNQVVQVEASVDGSTTWIPLSTINAATPKDKLYTVEMRPLLGSLSDDTAIRFRQSAGSGGEKLQLDFVEIAFTNAAPQIDPVFVTWSSALGTEEKAEWFDIQNVIEPHGYGPDGIYGYTSDEKAAFGGFSADVTPRHAIGKVELLLPVYARRAIPEEEVKIAVYVAGDKLSEIELPSEIFNNYVGVANAGTIAINLTNSHAWQWLDFSSDLEIVIEQRGFADDENQFVHYDGVGLRVTAMTGVDNSLDALLFGGNLPKAAFDVSKLIQAFPFAVRATEVWNQSPAFLQGQNVTVAVVDSGVGKIKDVKNRIVADVNFNRGYHDGRDMYGHGTFVAAILAGDGTSSQGKYTGIAPKVNFVNVRVSDDAGMSTEGDVLQSLQWVFENADEENIRVVNLSLNAAVAQSYHTSPLAAGVEMLWLRVIVVVVSAGNNGSADLYPPANSPRVITVGATDDKGTPGIADDEMAHFSAWGTDEVGNVKPDLVAPGTNIVAFVPNNGRLGMGRKHKENAVDKDYFRMSGTSMSAPIVAGAVAMLLQDEPNLTPDQVKFRLKSTANKNWAGYNATQAGAGYLDIYAAVTGTSTEFANQGLAPSELLRPFIMQMVDAGIFSDSGFEWNSVNWNSVNWNSVNWNSVNWNSVNWNSVNWNSVNWNSVNWNSVNWNSVNWNSDHWDGSYEMTQNVRERFMQPIPLEVNEEEEVDTSNLLFLPNVTAGKATE